MKQDPRPWQKYFFAAGATGVALLVRLTLSEWFGGNAPFLPFIAAVVLAAWLGGLGPGLLTTALSGVALALMLPPLNRFQIGGTGDLLHLLFFGGIGALISCLCESLHAARQRLAVKEEESARRLQELAAILESTPAVVYLIDTQDCFIHINRRWQEVFGLTNERVAGRSIYDFFPASIADQFQENNRQVLDAGSALEFEEVVPQDDGPHTYITVKVPIFDPAGAPYAICGISTDITERKRVERDSEEALKDADRRKDEFLATLAHELRSPLAPLRNGLQLIRLAGGTEATKERTLAMMDRQLSQMVRLIDDLLDVNRITSGKLELRKEPVELATVVEAAVETSRPIIEAAGHTLTVELPPVMIVVNVDRTRLAQVLSNLLTNAAKYTDPGGDIRLVAEQQGDEVVVTVQDSGLGIPADMLASIFEMFTQVNRSLERSQGGLGIGLTLAKRLVEMHGGSLEAKSEGEGKGSAFTIRLPTAVASPRTASAQDVAGRRGTLAKRRIVVADDNEDSAVSLAQLLELKDHEVRTATNGLEAVALAEAFRPDVILLDIGMPKLNGFDAARRIREQPWSRGVVLIALTGWGQEEDRRRSKEAGFDHHLVKPVDTATLEKLITPNPGMAEPLLLL